MNDCQGGYPPRGRAWASAIIVFVLTAIALADRMAISMLIGPIKEDFGIGDFQASLLIGFAFTLFYVLFLLPIGIAAEPPRDCRRLFGLSYAAMDTQSSMA